MKIEIAIDIEEKDLKILRRALRIKVPFDREQELRKKGEENLNEKELEDAYLLMMYYYLEKAEESRIMNSTCRHS